jgi:hypothetical protein
MKWKQKWKSTLDNMNKADPPSPLPPPAPFKWQWYHRKSRIMTFSKEQIGQDLNNT